MIKARLFSLLVSENEVITTDWIALIAASTAVGLLGVYIIAQSTVGVSDDLMIALRDVGVTSPAFEQVSQRSSNSQESFLAWLKPS